MDKKPNETDFDFGVRLGESLLGSSGDTPDEIFDGQDIAEGVDSVAMKCTTCSWWVPVGETQIENDEIVCDDCVN